MRVNFSLQRNWETAMSQEFVNFIMWNCNYRAKLLINFENYVMIYIYTLRVFLTHTCRVTSICLSIYMYDMHIINHSESDQVLLLQWVLDVLHWIPWPLLYIYIAIICQDLEVIFIHLKLPEWCLNTTGTCVRLYFWDKSHVTLYTYTLDQVVVWCCTSCITLHTRAHKH